MVRTNFSKMFLRNPLNLNIPTQVPEGQTTHPGAIQKHPLTYLSSSDSSLEPNERPEGGQTHFSVEVIEPHQVCIKLFPNAPVS